MSTLEIIANFDPIEFQGLAQELLGHLSGATIASRGSPQAKVRTAIGRSYYAAFLVAREKLVRSGKIAPRGVPQDHRLIVDALGGPGSQLGGTMLHLRRKRNQADYNLDSSGFSLQTGQYWLGVASRLITDVNNLP